MITAKYVFSRVQPNEEFSTEISVEDGITSDEVQNKFNSLSWFERRVAENIDSPSKSVYLLKSSYIVSKDK